MMHWLKLLERSAVSSLRQAHADVNSSLAEDFRATLSVLFPPVEKFCTEPESMERLPASKS